MLMIAILVIIIGIQVIIFGNLIRKISIFKNVFSVRYGYDKDEKSIKYPIKTNTVFMTIANCITSYLQNNGSRANDYHLMQDIVERNCDSTEEEIQSQVPTTLYLGLVGTMFGIIVGIAELFSGSGLSELVSGDVKTDAIEGMLKGVAEAMIASVCGIIFTTILTFVFKNAKAQNASGKNLFLSWIQANMLPNMSSDINTALEKMSDALSTFNSQFAENTQSLNNTLSIVSQTAESQADLYEKINQLDISAIAKANVKVYNALQNSTNEITYLAQMLHSSQDYVAQVRLLNENLDKSEQRTKLVEEMGNFFKAEIAAVEQRKQIFLDKIDEIDQEHVGKFNKIAGNFESKAENAIGEISEKFENQNNELRKLAAKQEDIVQNSDLSSLPLKMSALEEKVVRMEKFLGTTQSNLIQEIAKMRNAHQPVQTVVKEAPPQIIVKKNYVPSITLLAISALSAVIAIKGFELSSIAAAIVCGSLGLFFVIEEKNRK